MSYDGHHVVKSNTTLIDKRRGETIMVIFLLALIGTIFVINYLICLAILYSSEPAFTGPFGGWQWLLWPLVISSIANLFAFARPALNVLEDASAVSQGRPRATRNSTASQVPANASRGAIAA